MSAPYTIAAIPTVYAGRQYRSRLEAKWAAFFDLLGWQHEYEPFDLGIWSPDFLLTGDHGRQVLVEVKPIAEPDQDVVDKMCRAMSGRARPSEYALLLVGTAPWLAADSFHHHLRPIIGWRVVNYLEVPPDERASISQFLYLAGAGTKTVDFGPDNYPGGELTGCTTFFSDYTAEYFCCDLFDIPYNCKKYADEIMGKWAEASNAVQWKPPGARP